MFSNRVSYDEISPITQNLCVLIDVDPQTGIISKLCMQSGYTTNTLMKADSEEFWKSLTSTYSTGYLFAREDDKGNVWIPSAQSTEYAALYPITKPSENGSTEQPQMVWQVAPLRIWYEQGDEEPKVELDFDNAVNFELLEYEKAFELFLSLSKVADN